MGPTPEFDADADVVSGFPTIVEKLRFLSDPSAYPGAASSVSVVETHMSYVFLVEDRAYKLKKPVRYPFLDFSTVQARERNCREEVRLNRRLAAGVYLGAVPLTFGVARGLAIGGDATIVDWLVEMRRLPQERMLDRLLKDDGLDEAGIDAICDTLANFYRRSERSKIAAEDYVTRFFYEQAQNRDILMRRNFALDHGRTPVLLDRLDATLAANRTLLEARARDGHVVDGHGDLRPEHICLCDPIAIFDCLEFNSDLRQVDPFDELAYLSMECAQLGATEVGAKFIEKTAQRLGQAPPRRLVSVYTAWRAVLRARLAVAHLLDAVPRQPTKWEPLATRYLALAEQALATDILNNN